MATVVILLYSCTTSVLTCLLFFLICESWAKQVKIAVELSLSKAICTQLTDYRNQQIIQEPLVDQTKYSQAPHPCGWVHWKKCTGNNRLACNKFETKPCGSPESDVGSIIDFPQNPDTPSQINGPFLDFPQNPDTSSQNNENSFFIDFPQNPDTPSEINGPFLDFPQNPDTSSQNNENSFFIDFPQNPDTHSQETDGPIIEFPPTTDVPSFENVVGFVDFPQRENEIDDTIIDFQEKELTPPPGPNSDIVIDFPETPGPRSTPSSESETIIDFPKNSDTPNHKGRHLMDFPPSAPVNDVPLIDFPPMDTSSEEDFSSTTYTPSDEEDDGPEIDFPISEEIRGHENERPVVDFTQNPVPDRYEGPFVDFPQDHAGPPGHKGGGLLVSRSLALAICTQRKAQRRSNQLQPELVDKDDYDAGDIPCQWLRRNKKCSRTSGDCDFALTSC